MDVKPTNQIHPGRIFVERIHEPTEAQLERILDILVLSKLDAPLTFALSEDNTDLHVLLRARYRSKIIPALADEEVWVMGFGENAQVGLIEGAIIVGPPGVVIGRGPHAGGQLKEIAESYISAEAKEYRDTVHKEAEERVHNYTFNLIGKSPIDVYEIATFGINPAAQGQGIGTPFMRCLMERAEGENKIIATDTYTAVGFYKKLGFETPYATQVYMRRNEEPAWKILANTA